MIRDDASELRKQTRTRRDALVLRNRLMDDRDFAKMVSEGDGEALRLIAELSTQIVGSPENWSKPPENFGRTREDPFGERGEGV